MLGLTHGGYLGGPISAKVGGIIPTSLADCASQTSMGFGNLGLVGALLIDSLTYL